MRLAVIACIVLAFSASIWASPVAISPTSDGTDSLSLMSPQASTAAITPDAATTEVDIINFAFSPTPVTINVGDTIHWVWQASNFSTTSVAGSIESWDSGVHNVGFTFDHTFTHVGTINYYDVIHGFDNGDGTAGGEAGTIIVKAASVPEPAALALAWIVLPLHLRRRRPTFGRFCR